MNKRKSSDFECKENIDPNTQSVKKSKLDLLDEKLDIFSYTVNSKIDQIENLFQAQVERMETLMDHFSSNKDLTVLQNCADQEAKMSEWLTTNMDPSRQAEEFLDLLMNRQKLLNYTYFPFNF